MKNLFLVLGLICLFTNAFSQVSSKKLADGFYIVAEKIRDTSTVNKSKDASIAFVRFNPGFKENKPDSTEALFVYENNFVPLEFSKEPSLVKHSDGSKRLELFFSKSSADKLASITSENLMKQAAIIVDGKALTVHMIKAAITGGKMEISGCADNSCEKIMEQLKKYVK